MLRVNSGPSEVGAQPKNEANEYSTSIGISSSCELATAERFQFHRLHTVHGFDKKLPSYVHNYVYVSLCLCTMFGI